MRAREFITESSAELLDRMQKLNGELDIIRTAQQMLSKEDDKNRKKGNNVDLSAKRKELTNKWEQIGEKMAEVRKELYKTYNMDEHGNPVGQKRKIDKPSDDELYAEYNSPDEVPRNVMNYLIRHNQILTSDATDAVRWARIYNTEDDERYPSGQIEIYRATDSNYDEIRPGDWVTTSPEYANMHLTKYLKHGHVISDVVDGKDVLVSPTGNAEEAIYAPLMYSGT